MSFSPPESKPQSAGRRGGTARLGAMSIILFSLAFVWSSCRTYLPLRSRHELVPDLPALAANGMSEAVTPIADYLIREGQWDWPRGGRFYVLPGGKSFLAPHILDGERRAVREANERGAAPRWKAEQRASGYELCATVAWIADWWGGQMDHSPRGHLNCLTGLPELGLPPLGVAAWYETLRAGAPALFPLGLPDPVTRRPVPDSLEGLVRVMEAAASAEPSTATIPLRWTEDGWPDGPPEIQFAEFDLASPPRMVFSTPADGRPLDSDKAAEALSEAIRLHGIALVGLAEGARPEPDSGGDSWRFERAAVAIGDYTIPGRRLFLLRSPSGFVNGGHDTPFGYAIAPVEALRGAWVFPHSLRAEWRQTGPESTELNVFAADGRPLALSVPHDMRLDFDARIEAAGPGDYAIYPSHSALGSPLRLEIAVPYHMPADGKPLGLTLKKNL